MDSHSAPTVAPLDYPKYRSWYMPREIVHNWVNPCSGEEGRTASIRRDNSDIRMMQSELLNIVAQPRQQHC